MLPLEGQYTLSAYAGMGGTTDLASLFWHGRDNRLAYAGMGKTMNTASLCWHGRGNEHC